MNSHERLEQIEAKALMCLGQDHGSPAEGLASDVAWLCEQIRGLQAELAVCKRTLESLGHSR